MVPPAGIEQPPQNPKKKALSNSLGASAGANGDSATDFKQQLVQQWDDLPLEVKEAIATLVSLYLGSTAEGTD